MDKYTGVTFDNPNLMSQTRSESKNNFFFGITVLEKLLFIFIFPRIFVDFSDLFGY